MDWLFTLAIGVAVGIVCSYLFVQTRNWWKRSKDLRASAAKARKERKERDVKARQDMAKARSAMWQSFVRIFLLVTAIVVVGFVIWMVALS